MSRMALGRTIEERTEAIRTSKFSDEEAIALILFANAYHRMELIPSQEQIQHKDIMDGLVNNREETLEMLAKERQTLRDGGPDVFIGMVNYFYQQKFDVARIRERPLMQLLRVSEANAWRDRMLRQVGPRVFSPDQWRDAMQRMNYPQR